MAKTKKRFVYQKRTAEQVKTRAASRGSLYDSPYKSEYQLFTPKPGDVTIRVLPAGWDAADHYGYEIWVHSGVGADNQTYLCKERMSQGKCVICEEVRRAKREGDDDVVDSMSPYSRVLMWIINRDDEKAGPLLYPMPFKMDKNFLNISIDKKTGEALMVDDPEEGYDIEFVRDGQGLKTKYSGEKIARRPSPLNDDEALANKWLEYIVDHSIPDVLNYYDDDHILNIMSGGGKKTEEEEEETPPVRSSKKQVKEPELDEVDEEDEEDETPPPKSKKPAPKVEEDEDEDEDEDDEPTPVKSKKAEAPPAKKRAKLDDDDDEEDEEDEEEEERPQRGRTVSKTSSRSDDDDDDEDEDEEEDEPTPKKNIADKVKTGLKRRG